MASIWTLMTPPAVVYGGPGGPWRQRKFQKKSRLKKKLQPHISPRRRGDGKSKSITKLFTKIFSTTWHGFFCSQVKKIFDFFLLISLQWSYKILSMSLKIWTRASGCPRGLSIFWDPRRFSWPLGKIHFWKRVPKKRQILPPTRPWPPLGPTYKETNN